MVNKRNIFISALSISFIALIVIFLIIPSLGGNNTNFEEIDLSSIEWDLKGDTGVHDPVITREGTRWYIFYTGVGIRMKYSDDGVEWTDYGAILDVNPDWFRDEVPRSTQNIWAPDIFYFNDMYYLYYSVSSFGDNISAIGVTSNKTLDPDSDDYQWNDMGVVLTSSKEDDFNCIDPNVVLDEDNKLWMSFGSFWSGIKLVELSKDTMKPVDNYEIHSIAKKPDNTAIEAPFIIYKDGYYYNFVSFDYCCRKADSTYKIAVGRSENIVGPYVDKDGKSMLEGGGTIIDVGTERWKGPGHCAVFSSKDTYILVNHAYDADNDGIATLQIRDLIWQDGWPMVSK